MSSETYAIEQRGEYWVGILSNGFVTSPCVCQAQAHAAAQHGGQLRRICTDIRPRGGATLSACTNRDSLHTWTHTFGKAIK